MDAVARQLRSATPAAVCSAAGPALDSGASMDRAIEQVQPNAQHCEVCELDPVKMGCTCADNAMPLAGLRHPMFGHG